VGALAAVIPQQLSGATCVVTGAASGIGLGLARKAAREGMNVVLADVEQGALDAAEAEVAALGAKALAVRTDVTDPDAVEALAAATFEHFGGAHLVFLNAGVFQAGVSWQRSVADWEWVLGVNFWGPLHGVRSFIPRLLAQDEPAHVVITSSMAGLMTVAYSGPYVVSKFAAASLAECVAHDLRAQGVEHVRVSCIVPGAVATRIADSTRNRPPHLVDSAGSVSSSTGSAKPPGAAEPPSEAQAPDHHFVADTLREMTSTQGRHPDDAADIAFKAIRAGEFWITTSDSYEDLLRPRFESIIRHELPGSAQFD
jgi:NAD(P)-dependent dehydrogenase (short-subunit alcohol dehydrogenase family)